MLEPTAQELETVFADAFRKTRFVMNRKQKDDSRVSRSFSKFSKPLVRVYASFIHVNVYPHKQEKRDLFHFFVMFRVDFHNRLQSVCFLV